MVVLDCLANLSIIGILLLAYPVRVFGNSLCILIDFYRSYFIIINRIIPLVVVFYRYLMVCHVDICYNYGEKIIKNKLIR